MRQLITDRKKIGTSGYRNDNHIFRLGDYVYVLPLACGKKVVSQQRLKHYGKHGIIFGGSKNVFILTHDKERITVRLEDIVPYKNPNN